MDFNCFFMNKLLKIFKLGIDKRFFICYNEGEKRERKSLRERGQQIFVKDVEVVIFIRAVF